MARSERPISRWISCVRPPTLPAEASRRERSAEAYGNILYSAVIHPPGTPCDRIHGGTRSSTEAPHSTWVWPTRTSTEPFAPPANPASNVTGLSSSAARPSSLWCGFVIVLPGGLSSGVPAMQHPGIGGEAGGRDAFFETQLIGCSGAEVGSKIRNVVPVPHSLSSSMVPPCPCTMP